MDRPRSQSHRHNGIVRSFHLRIRYVLVRFTMSVSYISVKIGDDLYPFIFLESSDLNESKNQCFHLNKKSLGYHFKMAAIWYIFLTISKKLSNIGTLIYCVYLHFGFKENKTSIKIHFGWQSS